MGSEHTQPERTYVLHVCRVCGNLTAHGNISRADLQAVPAHCWGKDAPGFPGSHLPAQMEALTVVEVAGV